MDPRRHAELSARRRGGSAGEYYALHSFFDQTKELCSDNRHRLLHNHWGIRRVVLPIFGPTMTLASGEVVRTKAVCEEDHVLADYAGRYLPTLGDLVGAIRDDADDARRFRDVHRAYASDPEVERVLLSPLGATGQVKSLLVTHNAWFLHEILPRLVPRPLVVREFELAPAELFARMDYQLWMDNGAAPPPSAPRAAHDRGGSHVG